MMSFGTGLRKSLRLALESFQKASGVKFHAICEAPSGANPAKVVERKGGGRDPELR